MCLEAWESTLASASKDKTVKIWDTMSQTCLKSLHLHQYRVTTCKWLAPTTLVSADESGTLIHWDLEHVDHPKRLSAHQRAVTALHVVQPDCFVSGDSTGQLVFWNGLAGARQEHGSSITDIAHMTGASGAEDGIIVVTAADQRLRLWTRHGAALKDFRISFDFSRDHHWSIGRIVVGPSCVLYAGIDQFACDTELNDHMVLRLVYDVADGFTQEQGFAANSAGTSDSVGAITALALAPTPDTPHLLVGCEKKYAFALHPTTLAPSTHPAEGPFDGAVNGMAWLTDGAYAAVTARGEVFVRFQPGGKDVQLPTRTIDLVTV